jgi:hypothetical protein
MSLNVNPLDSFFKMIEGEKNSMNFEDGCPVIIAI